MDILEQVFGVSIYSLIKWGLVLLLLMHNVFAFIVYRQTRTLIRVVEAKFSPIILLIAFGHFILSIGTTLITLLFL